MAGLLHYELWRKSSPFDKTARKTLAKTKRVLWLTGIGFVKHLLNENSRKDHGIDANLKFQHRRRDARYSELYQRFDNRILPS